MGVFQSKEEPKNETSQSQSSSTTKTSRTTTTTTTSTTITITGARQTVPDFDGGARPREDQPWSRRPDGLKIVRRRYLPDVEGRSKTIIRHEKSEKLIVVAIDFGTTYTGYAYSWMNKKNEILTHYWEKSAIKTPTIVLMDKNKKYHSFGQAAKDKYLELIKKDEHKNWFYFENFKMKLLVRDGPLHKDMKLADMFGKKMPAIDVFAASIEYMKNHFLEKLHDDNKKEKVITVKDVHFIITVPAIWSDLSKQFMRQATQMAGIEDNAISLALEPEAASLYCKENLKGVHVVPGIKYIVADLGERKTKVNEKVRNDQELAQSGQKSGGTADFTCHEVNKDHTLKELQKPSGGDYGGTTVDNAFRKLLNKIIGADLLNDFKEQCMAEYCELFERFQVKKKHFSGQEKINIQFPLGLRQLYEDNIGESVETSLNSSPYRGRVEFKQDKMVISESLARDIFDEAVQKIVEKTDDLLKAEKNVQAIVLVGGFSESPYLQDVMKTKFNGKKLFGSEKSVHVLSPKEPASAVIKGAVMYGHQPKAIDSRICKYSYGIARMMIFKDYHKPEKLVKIKHVAWCNDLFNKHIEVGQTVRTDDNFKAEEYFPITGEMKQAVLEVYASPEPNPTYIDDPGCQLVGLIKIDLTGGDVNAKVLVKLIFGGTELVVEAVEEQTGKQTIGRVDFLG